MIGNLYRRGRVVFRDKWQGGFWCVVVLANRRSQPEGYVVVIIVVQLG